MLFLRNLLEKEAEGWQTIRCKVPTNTDHSHTLSLSLSNAQPDTTQVFTFTGNRLFRSLRSDGGRELIDDQLALPGYSIEMGSGAGSFIKVILKNFDVLAGPLVSLVYPLYASVRAIETKSHVDDQQWLTYWILYSMLTLFELTFAKVLEWIPIWPYAKLILSCWLVIPYFSGAAYVYEHFVRPLFINKQTVNIWYVPKMKDIFGKPDDILTAAEKYIAENGTEEFQNLINRADDRSRPSNRHVSFSNNHEYWH